MNDIAPEDPGIDDAQIQRLLNGAIRERIGISSKVLNVGLDVARSAMQRGAIDDAFRIYCSLVVCEPMNSDFQLGFANCLLEIEEYLTASQAASLAIALAPANPLGHYLSARAYLGLGYLDEARDDLHEAVRLGQAARDPRIVDEARKLLAVMSAEPAESSFAPAV